MNKRRRFKVKRRRAEAKRPKVGGMARAEFPWWQPSGRQTDFLALTAELKLLGVLARARYGVITDI